jgi:hypothetical protein
MRWVQYKVVSGQMRCLCKILVGKGEQKTLSGMLRRRWENNVKMDIKESRLEEVN